jgi:hypothetical protein
VIVVVIAALGYFVFMQLQSSVTANQRKSKQLANTSTASSSKQKAPALPRYRSTSIRPGDNACEAARAIVEQRFLVEDDAIPSIPLPGCDAASCACKYIKHSDRRDDEEEDRRDIVGIDRNVGSLNRDGERRKGRERRVREKLEWPKK